MAQARLTVTQMRETLALLEAHHGNVTAAAKACKMPRGTLQSRIRESQTRLEEIDAAEFTIPDLPHVSADVDEIRRRRRREWERTAQAEESRLLIPVQVHLDGPIGIAHFGDPHLDDPGTNLPLLERHIAIVKTTKGLFGGNVGDTTNNWPRRSALAYLHSEQSTTAAEAWALAKWFIEEIPWLYIIGGNHDLWSGTDDPLEWITQQAGALYEQHGARLGLEFPNGRVIRVNARHDFAGHSMWNTVHGASKAAQMGWRDHILTCGHKHTSGYQVVKDPATGLISHALRVAGYKSIDKYAKSRGLPNQAFASCAVTIIDPSKDDHDPAQVQVFFDLETAAEFLTWRRRKKAA